MTVLIEIVTLDQPDRLGWIGCDLPDEEIDKVIKEFVGTQPDGTPHEWHRLEAQDES